MTSPTIPAFTQPDLEGRSVRDVVTYSPGQVNDAWCRKILRKILQSLELQYAMQMPHRAITPDTIAFHANGEPLLLSEDIDAAPAPDAHQAEDLTALARVIHYAITQELVPAGPLSGRVEGYSAALVATVDACMDPDPARRPQSVDAVRRLLDQVAAASPLPPVPPVPIAVVAAHRTGMRQRWAIAAGGGAIALALVVFVALRDDGASAPIVLTQPQPSAGSLLAPPDSTAMNLVASPASGASSMDTTRSGDEHDNNQPDVAARVMPQIAPKPDRAADAPVKPAATADTHVTVPPRAVSANASYQLQIKPWGTVYVDGVERGVSPPLKRLTLTPGQHTVRITHPDYRDSVLEFDSAHSTSNGKIIVDFNNEAQ